MIIYFVSFSLSFYFKESTFEAFCKSSISRIKYFLCRSFLNVLFSNISLKLCTRSAGISQKICFIRGDTMVAEKPHLLFLFAIAWIFFILLLIFFLYVYLHYDLCIYVFFYLFISLSILLFTTYLATWNLYIKYHFLSLSFTSGNQLNSDWWIDTIVFYIRRFFQQVNQKA